ncbi:hypothetical protein BDR04DRAFT_1162198 [Suillus decipiens]|nr:hypothetical protein BDR04DRAFT_1162198 [Suillus decipiens]
MVGIAAAVPVMAPLALVPPTQAGSSGSATAGTSASTCWYIVTMGHETGVFQGWHNFYLLVGVLGACFGCHSSFSAAQTAYSEAVLDYGVMEVLH